jgi:hypothetical protein
MYFYLSEIIYGQVGHTISMSSIAGAIFPVSLPHAKRILQENKNVFVKYTKYRLCKNMKVIFYVSKEKKLIGEGRIDKVVSSEPSYILSAFKDRLFINENEYFLYTTTSSIGNKGIRSMKLITAFELIDLKEYRKAIELPRGVPPSGRYFTPQEYFTLKHL